MRIASRSRRFRIDTVEVGIDSPEREPIIIQSRARQADWAAVLDWLDRLRRSSMINSHSDRRAFLQVLLAAGVLPFGGSPRQDKSARTQPAAPITVDAKTRAYHVYPKNQIQDALEAAAKDPVNKTVYVHAGTYRPPARGPALIWVNARHDGVTLEAVGDVTLTAANPEVGDPQAPSYPAVVNHVVYFGDGVSSK